MSTETPSLFFLSVISDTGILIFEQQLTQNELDESLISSISNIALGFMNTIDVQLSSMNYLNYTIYFRRGTNFLTVLVTSIHIESEDVITSFFEEMQKQELIEHFVSYSASDIVCEDQDVIEKINRIIYNLNFYQELSQLKGLRSGRW